MSGTRIAAAAKLIGGLSLGILSACGQGDGPRESVADLAQRAGTSGGPDLSGYKMTFDDEFSDMSISHDGNGTRWIDTLWYSSNGGCCGNVNGTMGAFSVNNGVLTITATRNGDGSWNTGLIDTNKSFNQTYGYFEIRAAVDRGLGLWPAFWLLREDHGDHAEIDVWEGSMGSPYKVFQTIHWQDSNGDHSTPYGTAVRQVAVDTSQGFHTYGALWTSSTLSMYFDGELMYTQPTPGDMHVPMYLIANLGIDTGGVMGEGAADGSSPSPARMHIDYIRAYSSDPNAVPVGPSPSPSPAPAPAPGNQDGYIFPTARHSGKCMGVKDALMADGTPVIQWDCWEGATEQKWSFVSAGNGQFTMVNGNSGKCMHLAGDATSNSTVLEQQTCVTGKSSQLFTLKDMGAGYAEIVSVASGRCIDVSGASTANGAPIIEYDCSGGGNQQWAVGALATTAPPPPPPPPPLEYVFPTARHSGKCMGVRDASTAEGTLVIQWDCWQGATEQQWAFVSAGNGQYQMLNKNSGQCMHLVGDGTANFIRLEQRGCASGKASQLFTLQDMGSGYAQIKSVASGRCISVSTASKRNGAAIAQYDCRGGSSQQWAIGALPN